MTPSLAIEAAQSVAKSLEAKHPEIGRWLSNAVENVQWAEGWADGREAPKGIAYADWNDPDRYDPETKTRVDLPGKIMSRLCAILEKMGVEIEWSDQVSTCDDCGLLIQTEPDSYSWQPDYVVGDGSITCAKCMDPESYLDELADEHGFNSLESVNPSEFGWVRLNASPYESGWHPGQNDDPRKVAKQLEARGIRRFFFHKDEQSQFYSKWSVYVDKESSLDAFQKAYVTCALWSSTDNADDSGGEPLDKNYGIDDLDVETIEEMREDCDKFREKNRDLLEKAYDHESVAYNEARAGHDLWLTRNGHGAGFWGRGLGEAGNELAKAAAAMGGRDLYVTDDGKIAGG